MCSDERDYCVQDDFLKGARKLQDAKKHVRLELSPLPLVPLHDSDRLSLRRRRSWSTTMSDLEDKDEEEGLARVCNDVPAFVTLPRARELSIAQRVPLYVFSTLSRRSS